MKHNDHCTNQSCNHQYLATLVHCIGIRSGSQKAQTSYVVTNTKHWIPKHGPPILVVTTNMAELAEGLDSVPRWPIQNQSMLFGRKIPCKALTQCLSCSH